MIAEDRCRGEHFMRIRRELERAKVTGARTVQGTPFDPDQPWNAVFIAAARDEIYWDREVRRPAGAFLIRGSSAAMPAVSAQAAAAVAGILGKGQGQGRGQQQQTQPTAGTRGQKRRQNRANSQPPQQQAQQTGKGGKNGKGTPKGGKYNYTREGQEICFKFARGGRAACADVCPSNRAHACQYCLQPHQNSECEARPRGKGGKNAK